MRGVQLPWTLASASPRRLELLRSVGVEPRVLPADVDELENGDTPANLAMRNAIAKADVIAQHVFEGLLLAADTVVVLEGRSLGKPGDAASAREMLELLSGREHEVITGYSLRWLERGLRVDDFESTRVRMRTLRSDEIEDYISSGEPFDKAGGYGIQGAASAFVERVEGCYFNVVGLPVARIVEQVNLWCDPPTP